jgi:alpha-tubulin N-acetyltransferase 1
MVVVDELGYASAAAQSLHGPITTLSKLRSHPNQRLYIMRENIETIQDTPKILSKDDLMIFNSGGLAGYNDYTSEDKFSIVGMLKVGVKTLFVTVSLYAITQDELNRQVEISPLCVLDFFIDNNLQRKGFGKKLFEFMLNVRFVADC